MAWRDRGRPQVRIPCFADGKRFMQSACFPACRRIATSLPGIDVRTSVGVIYGTVCRNNAFTKPQRTLVSGFGRMLVLNRPGGRKAKVASAKVTAPRPFNLPSLKSENSGLDPATQIVPSGGGGWGGGQRPEDDEGMHPGLATPFLGYANG
jgi:hypothetical protein